MNLFTLSGRIKQAVLCSFLLMASVVAKAQFPVAYYDFEDNAARNTLLETVAEAVASGVGSPSLSVTGGLTQVLNANSGNGTNAIYGGGANAGYALGYFGFSTATTPASTAASINFGPFNTTGLTVPTLTYDVMGIGAKAPQNARIYYSINGGTSWANATTTTGAAIVVSNAYTTNTVVLPAAAGNVSALLIKIVGYNAGASPTSTDGVMMVDNFTLKSGTITGSTTLISAAVHGAGLSSGGSFVPEYASLTVSGTGITVTAASSLLINGRITLTSGVFDIGNNTLTFQNSTLTPLARTSGTLTVGSGAQIVFGPAAIATATTLPNNMFTSSPATFAGMTINRGAAYTVNLGSNPVTLSGNLDVTSGTFVVNSASGALVVQGNANVNAATLSVSAAASSITVQGDLNLTSGTVSNGNATAVVTVQGNITGTGTQVATSTGRIAMTGSGKTLSSTVAYDNVEINSSGDISLTGSTAFTGILTLTSGNLLVGAFNTLTLTTTATQIVKTSGFITMDPLSDLVFGDGTDNTSITLPTNTFTAPTIFSNLTVNRGTGTITWGNNPVNITGNVDASSPFIVNNATGTIVVGGDVSVTATTFTVSAASAIVAIGGNLDLSASSTLTVSAAASVSVTGDVDVDASTVSLTAASAALNIVGNLNMTTGTISTTNASAAVSVQGNVTGTGLQTVASTGKLVMVGTGTTLSSGITYDNVEINSVGNVSLTGSTTFTGVVTLTTGNLVVGASNTLTFITLTNPVVKTAGFITMNPTSNLVLGNGTDNTSVTLPAATFTLPTTFASLTANRGTGTVTWGDNPVTITGNVNASSPLTINTTTGTLSVGGNMNVTSTTLSLTAVSASVSITGNLNLSAGIISTTQATAIITVQGSVTGTGSQTVASTGEIMMTGSGTTLSSGVTYDNVEVNSAGNVSLTGATTFTGVTTLTAGNLVFGANTVTYNSASAQIVKAAGFITLNTGTNLIFGLGTGTLTVPDNMFNGSSTIASMFVQRAEAGATASRTMNWGNNPITISGNLDIVSGSFNTTFGTNDAAGTITVNGNLNFTSGTGVSILTTVGAVTVNGNVVLIGGTGRQTGSGKIIMTGNAGVASLAGILYSNVELNSSNNFSLAGSPAFSGTLTLTTGDLAVGSNTLTLHTSSTPIARTSGTINLSSTSGLAFGAAGLTAGNAFTIPANTFSSSAPEFANFTINRSNNLTLNSQNFAINGILAITAGKLVLPAGYIFTLRSTSITNTAMVDQVGTTGSIAYGAGAAFRVERYIPQTGGTGRRAYRDVSPSVNTGSGTIFTNWQESGTNGLSGGVYYGTHITGVVGASPGGTDAATGLDITQSGAKSLNTYDENLPSAWNTVNTTNQTNDTLSAFKGYRILIRGDRTVNLYGVSVNTMNAPATLRSTGKLITGDVVFNTSGVTANGGTNTGIKMSSNNGGYTLIGNPYAAPVDWHLLYAAASGIDATYWLYDANVGTIGGYVTYNAFSGSNTNTTGVGSSAANRYIQPGQAIFTVNTSTSPVVTFTEAYKAVNTANLTATFRTTSVEDLSKLYINFKKSVAGSGNIVMDGTAVAYDTSFSNAIGKEDGKKFYNSNENICVLSAGEEISVEGRVQPTNNDTIKLRIWQVTAGTNYQLEIDASKFLNNGLQAYLLDKFTGTQTSLSMASVTNYAFVTTSNTASYGNRFNIVFKASGVLPVSFTSIKAYQQNSGINVDWSVAESNISKYEVLRSADGQQFTSLGVVAAKGNGSSSIQDYSWFDGKPISGNNFYRIRYIDQNGSSSYSAIVVVKLNNKNESIVVYPNPVRDRNVNMQLNNIAKGDYTIALYNTNGQTVYAASFKHAGGNATQSFQLPQSLATGLYKLSIKGAQYNNEQSILIQ